MKFFLIFLFVFLVTVCALDTNASSVEKIESVGEGIQSRRERSIRCGKDGQCTGYCRNGADGRPHCTPQGLCECH
ncbi:hypothetical protein JTB14_031171 [Gonioctena quinquepunctata]|nr:hypothetical protein JTB14_031171 [Gonioctena quinquepunctata]